MKRSVQNSFQRQRETRQIIDAVSKIKGMSYHHSQQLLKYFRITGQQLAALRAVSENPRITLSELSSRMYIHNSTISGIVDRLERRGYLVRHRDEQDRRVIYLRISTEGKQIVKKAPMYGLALLIQNLDRLPSSEVHRLWGAIHTILNAMKIQEGSTKRAGTGRASTMRKKVDET